ncbi:MAG: methyltransferase domain-containing protein [Candidatus Aenigmatarchaeota archaeon]
MKIKKLLIKKLKREYIKDLNRDVTVQKQEFHNIRSLSQDFSTKFGTVKRADLQKSGKIKLKNQEYFVIEPSLIDQLKNIKRTSQMIPVKDIGIIITETGVNRDSIILDSGSGSGGIACFLAFHAKKVITCDISDENIAVTQQNVKELELNNVEVKKADITKTSMIKEKDIDVFTLDIPNPNKAVPTANKVLKLGGFFVNYSPNITQSLAFANKIKEHPNFLYIKTIELIEREWKLDGKIARPVSESMIPSGFLTFSRKIN